MKRIETGLSAAALILVVRWCIALDQTAAAAQKGSGCTLPPLPLTSQLVNQGEYLGGINALGHTDQRGLGRQIRVGKATYAGSSTETIMAVSGATWTDSAESTPRSAVSSRFSDAAARASRHQASKWSDRGYASAVTRGEV